MIGLPCVQWCPRWAAWTPGAPDLPPTPRLSALPGSARPSSVLPAPAGKTSLPALLESPLPLGSQDGLLDTHTRSCRPSSSRLTWDEIQPHCPLPCSPSSGPSDPLGGTPALAFMGPLPEMTPTQSLQNRCLLRSSFSRFQCKHCLLREASQRLSAAAPAPASPSQELRSTGLLRVPILSCVDSFVMGVKPSMKAPLGQGLCHRTFTSSVHTLMELQAQ